LNVSDSSFSVVDIVDCMFQANGGLGADILYPVGITISDSKFQSNLGGGVRVLLDSSGATTMKAVNVVASENSGGYGMEVQQASALDIVDCCCNGGGGAGLFATGIGSAAIRKSSFNENGSDGIQTVCRSQVLSDCVADGNGDSGMLLRGIGGALKMEGCCASRNGLHGIRADDASTFDIINCTTNQNTNHGIFVDEGGVGTVQNCTAHKNADSGICVSSVDTNCPVVLKENITLCNGEFGIVAYWNNTPLAYGNIAAGNPSGNISVLDALTADPPSSTDGPWINVLE